jgi:phosphate starvation-inducible protein PhoH
VKGNTLTILDGPFDVLKECSESLNLWHQTVAAGGQIEMAPRTGSPVQLDSASGSTTSRKRSFGVKPKNEAQREYLEMIREETLTLGIGSAGTGKSFLAVAAAVQALEAKEVEKIIVTRPAVESGEKLGFLPGTADEKTPIFSRFGMLSIRLSESKVRLPFASRVGLK